MEGTSCNNIVVVEDGKTNKRQKALDGNNSMDATDGRNSHGSKDMVMEEKMFFTGVVLTKLIHDEAHKLMITQMLKMEERILATQLQSNLKMTQHKEDIQPVDLGVQYMNMKKLWGW